MAEAATEPELDLGPGALNITGQRFGQLTALHLIRKSSSGNRWLFSCDCGGLAERTAGEVRSRIKLGFVPQCAVCLREQTAGFWIEKTAQRRSRYADLYARTGRLWSWTSEDRLARDIANALDEEGWDPPQEEMPLPLACYSLLDAMAMAKRAAQRYTPAERREKQRTTYLRKKAREARETEAMLVDLRERGRAAVAIDLANSWRGATR